MKKRAVSLLLALVLIAVVVAVSFVSFGVNVIGQAGECTDSDGSRNYFVAGVTQNSSNSSTDYCFLPTRLREYYCSLNNVKTELYNCPNGLSCTNGACRPVYTFAPNHPNEVIHRDLYWKNVSSTAPTGNWVSQDIKSTVPGIATLLAGGGDWYIGDTFTPIDYSTVPVTALYGCCSVNGLNTSWSGFIPSDYDCSGAVDGNRWHIAQNGSISPGREQKYFNNGSDHWECGWVIESWSSNYNYSG